MTQRTVRYSYSVYTLFQDSCKTIQVKLTKRTHNDFLSRWRLWTVLSQLIRSIIITLPIYFNQKLCRNFKMSHKKALRVLLANFMPWVVWRYKISIKHGTYRLQYRIQCDVTVFLDVASAFYEFQKGIRMVCACVWRNSVSQSFATSVDKLFIESIKLSVVA